MKKRKAEKCIWTERDGFFFPSCCFQEAYGIPLTICPECGKMVLEVLDEKTEG